MDDIKKSKKADNFFRREFSSADIQKSAHFTYRDGFRLGFGFFVGFMLGLIILTAIVAGVNNLFKLL
jgi:hypothetical protein